MAAGDRDVTGAAHEFQAAVDQAPLVVDARPAVGAHEHLVGRPGQVSIGAGLREDPQRAQLSVGHVSARLIADGGLDPVVDADERPVAGPAVADEADLRRPVVADESHVRQELRQAVADRGRQVRPARDDDIEAAEALGIAAGGVREGPHDRGDRDDPCDPLLLDPPADRPWVEGVRDVHAAAAHHALDDRVEGEAVGDGSGRQGRHAGERFQVGGRDRRVRPVLPPGLEEPLGVAGRPGREEQEERLLPVAHGGLLEGAPCVSGLLHARQELRQPHDRAGPAPRAQGGGQILLIRDDEADARVEDDVDAVLQRPARIDRRGHRPEAGQAHQDARGLERGFHAHRGDRDAAGLRGRGGRGLLPRVECLHRGEDPCGVLDEFTVGERPVLPHDRGAIRVLHRGVEHRLRHRHERDLLVRDCGSAPGFTGQNAGVDSNSSSTSSTCSLVNASMSAWVSGVS